MPVLDNPRWEAFAQEVAKGMSASKAYVVVGYAKLGAHRNAARLMANDRVRARIVALQTNAADRVEITLEGLIAHAEKIRQYAMDRKVKNLPAANTAVVTMAKLAGLWVEKRESTLKHADPAKLTDHEIIQALSELRGEPVGAAPEAEGDPGKLH